MKSFNQAFPYNMLGFEVNKEVGEEVLGQCPFCLKLKFYINSTSGKFSCKGGGCDKEGNVFTFIRAFYNELCDTPKTDKTLADKFASLASNRGFSVDELIHYGVKWNEGLERFVIPVISEKNEIVNFRMYKAGSKTFSLTGINVAIGGLDKWSPNSKLPIFLCEGEWDAMALEILLKRDGVEGQVLWMPGAKIFKDGFEKYFKGRDVYCCYDNDVSGEIGKAKVNVKLSGVAKSLKMIVWPKELPNKFDIRDFYTRGGDMEKLLMLFEDFVVTGNRQDKDVEILPPLKDGNRIKFDEVLAMFNKHMKLTPDMVKGIKIICAMTYAKNIKSIPLWLHIVGPPGSGKTEILMAFDGAANIELRSSVTSKSLVSGFSLPGGRDPSLLPCLFGKTFILKDFTEVLQMNKSEKEEVDSILRGAYDGVVTKQFGNGVLRHYEGTFNVITGVTQEIFGEARTSLGERFLIYHMVKGIGFNVDEIIRAALSNSGEELLMRTEMGDGVKKFLAYSFTDADVPPVDKIYEDRIIALSQTVAVLRAHVTRDFREEKMSFRPQVEVGTRLAKQLFILLKCLGMCNDDWKVTEEDYKIVARVALDSCKGLCLEIANFVAEHEGCQAKDISDGISLPMTSLRGILDDLLELKFLVRIKKEVEGIGPPSYAFNISDFCRGNWDRAGLGKVSELKSEVPRVRLRFKKSVK